MRTEIGNIADVNRGIVVHQVNCRNRIGAGVSGAIIEKWPKVAAAYHELCGTKPATELLGTVQYVTIREPDRLGMNGLKVVNLFAQLDYGNARKTGCVYTKLVSLVKGILRVCYENPDQTVYIPHGIGCGLGGEEWVNVWRWLYDVPNLVEMKYK